MRPMNQTPIDPAEYHRMRLMGAKLDGYRPCFCCTREDSNYEAWGIYICDSCNDAGCLSDGCKVPDSPWTRLADALTRHEEWSRGSSLSGFVGLTTYGNYFAGVNIDGEQFMEVQAEGCDSPTECIDRLVANLRTYRVERDAERVS